MKTITILSFCIFIIGCSVTRHKSHRKENLDGLWAPVKQELGGRNMPAAFFQNQTLLVNDTTYILTAESVDKGTVKYRNGQMDIYGKEGVNTGKHFTALYKLNNDTLTVCYNLKGDNYPVDFETKSKPTLFLSVFTKMINKTN